MMLRLLIIEAATYPKPNTPPRLWPKHQRARKLVGFDDDKPEDWRVSFWCRSGACVSPERQDAGGPQFYSAWPLAERYEALHLPKRQREQRSGELADVPDLVGRLSFENIEAAARDARPAFDSS